MLASFDTAFGTLQVTAGTLAVFGIGLGSMLLIFGLSGAFSGTDPVRRRLKAQAHHRRRSGIEAGLLRPADNDPSGLMKALLPADRTERSRVRRQLAEAGVRSPHGLRNYYLVRLLLGLVLPGLVLAAITLSRNGHAILPEALDARLAALSQFRLIQLLSLLVGVGFFGPVLWLRSRVAERRRQIEESFPNVLDLLQISTEAGLGLDAAMIRVANESLQTAPAISEEFLMAQREIQAGRSRDKALQDMADRTGIEEINAFASVVLQSLQFGASISDALHTYATEMRRSRELRAQEMANKLPVKMSAIMAALMLPALIMLAIGPVVIRYIRYMHG